MQKFQDLRSRLEKQYTEAQYVPESGWTEEQLWAEYEKHCRENPAVLRDAQAHPEKYSNLQVRVCGWNVRFHDLSPAAQETFIRQAETL